MTNSRMHRPLWILVTLILALLLTPLVSWSHHGWGWATDEEFEITGSVVEVSLGNPHGEVTIDSEGRQWVVEVGQPWRNGRAGLSEALLQTGVEITVHGHRSANKDVLVVKAERLFIDGVDYDLYPERE